MRTTDTIDFQKVVEDHFGGFMREVQAGAEKDFIKLLGRVSIGIIEREMKSAGIRNSMATGTHLGRTKKQRVQRQKWGSILEPQYQTRNAKRGKGRLVFKAGFNDRRAHVARFRSDGTTKNRMNWGRDSGAPVPKTNFMDNARKQVDNIIPNLFTRVAKRVAFRQRRGRYRREF